MNFIFLSLVPITVGIILAIISTKSWRHDWLAIPATILISIGIIMFLIPGISRLSFIEWETSFQLLSNAFEQIENKEQYIYIWDIAESNKELFEYQASYLCFGEWSAIPARVMDIKPIG